MAALVARSSCTTRGSAGRARPTGWFGTKAQLVKIEQKLDKALKIPRPLPSAMDYGEDGCYLLEHTQLNLSFMLWDCNVRNVIMGCCDLADSVYVIMRYDDAQGVTKVFRGEAWSADAACAYKGRRRAALPEVVSFFSQMRSANDALKAHIVFDGNLSMAEAFDLHLHFEHPVQNRSLLVMEVARETNPLIVIDKFQ